MTDWQRRFPPRKPWPTAVDQLSDVDDAAPADGDTLVFDAASGLWKPGPAASPINDASDVPYDPTSSGLGATDVQAAIDQVAALTTGGWNQVAAWTKAANGNVTQVVANVTGYSECLCIVKRVALSAANWRYVQVSVNGGVSYLTASGNYIEIDTDGIEANNSNLVIHSTSSALARSGHLIIHGVRDSTAAKPVTTPTRGIPGALIVGSASPITHVKIHAGGATMNAGEAYIYAR